VTGSRYDVTDVIFETPRYLQVPGGIGVTPTSATGPIYVGTGSQVGSVERDLIGSGWAEITEGTLTVAIRPDGIVGHFEPKEKRSYPLASVSGWQVSGEVIEVTFGTAGPVASTEADAPAHLGTMKCASAEAASALTAEARASGLALQQAPRHSGI
jgi:hypothetical protein